MIVFDYVFPIIGGELRPPPENLAVGGVFGTAFSIGNDYFLTADHVMQGASSHPAVGIAKVTNEKWWVKKITGCERFPEWDTALLHAALPDALALPWMTLELPLLAPVEACG